MRLFENLDWVEEYIYPLAGVWHNGDRIPTFISEKALIAAAFKLCDFLGSDQFDDLNRVMEYLHRGAFAVIKADYVRERKVLAAALEKEAVRMEHSSRSLERAGAEKATLDLLQLAIKEMRADAQNVRDYLIDPRVPALNSRGTEARRRLRAAMEAIVRALIEGGDSRIRDDPELKRIAYNLALAVSGAEAKYDSSNDAATLINQVLDKVSIVPNQ